MQFGNMFKQAQQMQAKVAEAQEKVKLLQVTGSSGGGKVSVSLKGSGEVDQLSISPDVVSAQDVELLEDLIIAAFNEAKKKLDDESNTLMNAAMGNMKLPAGLKMPF